jgi:cytochrome c553
MDLNKNKPETSPALGLDRDYLINSLEDFKNISSSR